MRDLLSLPIIKTRKDALPIFLEGGKKAIFLIHGYTGGPYDFSYLAPELNKSGFTVCVPRLPGHGTCGDDFVTTCYLDWLRKVLDTYYDLSAQYEEVYVGGLSMGGALALVLSSIVQSKKLAVMATSINRHLNRVKLGWFVGLFVDRIPKDNNKKIESCTGYEYGEYKWPIQAEEVYRLKRVAKRRIPLIKSDTLVIVSKKDPIAPESEGRFVYENLKVQRKELVVLENSGHVVTNDIEREFVAEKVIEWFSK